jgi:hypothetical protein
VNVRPEVVRQNQWRTGNLLSVRIEADGHESSGVTYSRCPVGRYRGKEPGLIRTFGSPVAAPRISDAGVAVGNFTIATEL